MRLQIFNVGHGFCSLLTGNNGNAVLFDCGHSDTFRPSSYLPTLPNTELEQLVITNFDRDHVSDLHNLRRSVNIPSIARNPTMPADRLRALKLEGGPLTTSLQAAIELHATYTAPLPTPLDLGDTILTHYWNPYPTFNDTNNLSFVTFIDSSDLCILVPGDMEKAGWRQLLCQDSFQQDLTRTNIIVAAHHGRDSGYCQELFRFCVPDVAIISDEAIQYETQEHCYATHTSGLPSSDGSTRHVLTTRSDGHITITKDTRALGYYIRTHPLIPPH